MFEDETLPTKQVKLSLVSQSKNSFLGSISYKIFLFFIKTFVKPRFKIFDVEGDFIGYLISLNLEKDIFLKLSDDLYLYSHTNDVDLNLFISDNLMRDSFIYSDGIDNPYKMW